MRPIAPYARLGTQAEAPSVVKVWRTKDSNSPNACHEPTYDNEGTNPYSLEQGPFTGICIGIFWWDGSVSSWPWVGKNCSVPGGPCQPNAVRTHGDMLYTHMWTGTCTIGRGDGSSPSLIHSLPIHLLRPESTISSWPTNMVYTAWPGSTDYGRITI